MENLDKTVISAFVAFLKKSKKSKQNMADLNRLIIKTSDIMIDGYQWKQRIIDHLPKLKVFKFYMIDQLHECDDKEEAIACLLDFYRTSYWLIDRQWFVRCQWTPGTIIFFKLDLIFRILSLFNHRAVPLVLNLHVHRNMSIGLIIMRMVCTMIMHRL
jgi:hypothetical protein